MRQHSSDNSSQFKLGPAAAAFGAGALIIFGLSRRSKTGTALATAGGVLAFTAAKAKSFDTQNTAKATFLVNVSTDKAYELWRKLENLPRFMAHLKSVRALDERQSEWVAVGPLGREIQWKAEITEDVPNQRIAWKALPESDVEHSGFVEFRADPQGRGSYVSAELQYSVPASALASGLASLMGKHPEFMVREDLRRFKALLEADETPTTAGQSHGPRGVHGRVERVLFRETSNHPQPQATSVQTNEALTKTA